MLVRGSNRTRDSSLQKLGASLNCLPDRVCGWTNLHQNTGRPTAGLISRSSATSLVDRTSEDRFLLQSREPCRRGSLLGLESTCYKRGLSYSVVSQTERPNHSLVNGKMIYVPALPTAGRARITTVEAATMAKDKESGTRITVEGHAPRRQIGGGGRRSKQS